MPASFLLRIDKTASIAFAVLAVFCMCKKTTRGTRRVPSVIGERCLRQIQRGDNGAAVGRKTTLQGSFSPDTARMVVKRPLFLFIVKISSERKSVLWAVWEFYPNLFLKPFYKPVLAYLCFGTEKNRRIGQQKKPDIFGLFAGDIFFVSTLWLLRTVMMHPVFGISYFIRLGAFRDMLHFVRRDIFACAKVILRPWRSGILFAHTTAVGNSTRRSRISLRSNRTRVRRE